MLLSCLYIKKLLVNINRAFQGSEFKENLKRILKVNFDKFPL